jgi:hypothetical protein
MDLHNIWKSFRKKEIGRKSRLFLQGKAFILAMPFLVAAAPGPEGSAGGCQTAKQVREEPSGTAQQGRMAEATPPKMAKKKAEPASRDGNQDAAPSNVPKSQPAPLPDSSPAKDLPKIAVWDLVSRNTPASHAQELTSILVSELGKIKKYEVYSQENVRTLAGWTEERMKLGCTSTQCLTALGQMDIAKLISGSVAKIGSRYSVSLNLFDTQNSKAEQAISEFCNSEDELIELVQIASRKLLGAELPPAKTEGRPPDQRAKPAEAQSPSKPILKR